MESAKEISMQRIALADGNGTRFMCLNNACTEEDKARLGCFAGGGLGG